MKDFFGSLFTVDSLKQGLIVLGALGAGKGIVVLWGKTRAAIRNSSWAKGSA